MKRSFALPAIVWAAFALTGCSRAPAQVVRIAAAQDPTVISVTFDSNSSGACLASFDDPTQYAVVTRHGYGVEWHFTVNCSADPNTMICVDMDKATDKALMMGPHECVNVGSAANHNLKDKINDKNTVGDNTQHKYHFYFGGTPAGDPEIDINDSGIENTGGRITRPKE